VADRVLVAAPRRVPTVSRRSRTARPPRIGPGILAGVLLGLVVVVGSGARAGAAVVGFTLSPTSGPAGTVVQASGTGCAPGITLSPTQDHVKISSTTLALSTDVAVAADGSWHGTFAVPANAPALPGLVAALCFTNGLPSLTTIYAPQRFTVTGPLVPPAPVTLPTVPTTPTTATAEHTTTTTSSAGATPTPTPTPGSTTVTPGTGTGGTGGGHGGGGTRPGSGNGGGDGAPAPGAGDGTGTSVGGGGSGPVPGRAPSGASATGDRHAATAAALDDPMLTSSTTGRGGGTSPWLFWLVLLALVLGTGLLLRWWHRREPVEGLASDAPTDAS
jgi:hypothetical protein